MFQAANNTAVLGGVERGADAPDLGVQLGELGLARRELRVVDPPGAVGEETLERGDRLGAVIERAVAGRDVVEHQRVRRDRRLGHDRHARGVERQPERGQALAPERDHDAAAARDEEADHERELDDGHEEQGRPDPEPQLDAGPQRERQDHHPPRHVMAQQHGDVVADRYREDDRRRCDHEDRTEHGETILATP